MNPPKLIRNLIASWPPASWLDVNVGVALSGGADSVALLRSLAQVKQAYGGRGELIALHVNHQLRGAASDAEQAWCEALCHELGITFQAIQGAVAVRAQAEGDGVEAAARQERYALLTKFAEQRAARYLAVAHTQNDQVETVLFRILRGTGIKGLSGMHRTRPLSPTVCLIRPLLSCTRADIEAYLAAEQQSFCSDESNLDLRFARNRLRNELLPLLRAEYEENVDQALLRLAEQAAEIQGYLEAEAEGLLSRDALSKNAPELGRLRLEIASLKKHPQVLVREALRISWREAGLPEQEMNFDWWCQLATLAISGDSTRTLNLPGNLRSWVEGEKLMVDEQPC